MMIFNVATLLPPYVEENFKGQLNEFDTSLIISVFSIAQIVFAPINSIIKNFLGAKRTILVGFFVLTTTTLGLGFMAYIEDANIFKWTGLIIRFAQGQGDIML